MSPEPIKPKSPHAPVARGKIGATYRGLPDQARVGYAVAVLGTAVATLARWEVGKIVGASLPPYIMFYPVIIFSALIGGMWAGLLATVLSSAAVTTLFLWPFDSADSVGFGFFVGINIISSLIAGGFRNNRRALKASNARLAGVVESAMDAVISVDENQRVVLFNPAAARMFGCAAQEAIGQAVDRFIPERFRAAHREHIRQFGESGATARKMGALGELAALRAGGNEFPIEASISRVEAEGQTLFTVILRDISSRKEAEAKVAAHLHEVERANGVLREREQQLQAANTELNDFATIVSHDLKAPLRGVATLAKWLQTDYADKLEGEGRENLAEMNQRVVRLDRMIDGILHYSRLGRLQEKPEPVALAELVRLVIEDLAPPANVRVRVSPGMPVVMGEPVRLRQLFQNLIGNAIKFADKPQIDIAVDWEDAGAFWQLTVTDNGPGIEKRHFERIFKMFQTLAPKDRTDSTGVGLALVHRIVELAGGRVWLDSSVGNGSSFHFAWPKVRAAAPGQSRESITV